MRTTVTLDDDIYQAAAAQAEASGKNLGAVLSELARRGLRVSNQTAKKNGLPVFDVRKSVDIIPSSRAKELLSEDAT